MKKLMFAVAAIAASVAIADVTSANTVGYSNVSMTENDPMIIFGLQFNAVGTDQGVKFKDLIGDFENEDNLQFSYTDEDELAAFRDFYYYTQAGWGVPEDGWYNDDTESVADELLTHGRAAWFSPAEPKSIGAAGEVKKGSKIHTFVDPMTFTCSYYPVPFCPNSANVSWPNAENEDNIQVARTDEDGIVYFVDYYYYTQIGWGVPEDGWYNDETELLDPDFAVAGVGEGFWYSPVDFESAAWSEVSPLGLE